MNEKAKPDLRGNRKRQSDDIPRLKVQGEFLDRVSLIESVTMSLVVSLGEVEKSAQRVLVPFVALKSTGFKSVGATTLGVPTESETIDELILPLENAAYFLSGAAEGLESCLTELGYMSSSVKPETARMYAIRQMVEDAKKSLEGCGAELDKLLGSDH